MSVGAGKYRKQYELVRDNLMAYAKKCHADFRFIDDYIDKDKKRDIYSQKLFDPGLSAGIRAGAFPGSGYHHLTGLPGYFCTYAGEYRTDGGGQSVPSARFRKIYATTSAF